MWHLVYCMCVVSVGWTRVGVDSTSILVQPTDITCTQYTKCHLCSNSWGWASDAWNMYRPFILNKLNKTCITLVSVCWLWKGYTGLYRQREQCHERLNEDTDCPLNVKPELVALCDSWWVVVLLHSFTFPCLKTDSYSTILLLSVTDVNFF
jgi:hypothetical protein